MNPDKNAPPLNPVPGVVWLLALPIIAAELVLSAAQRGLAGGPAGVGWRTTAIQDYGFSDAAFEWMLDNRVFPAEFMIRFLTYPFVHWNFTHALFALVFLLALGKFVGEVFRPWALVAVFFGASIGGAAAFALLTETPLALVGAYPAVYGLIGAFTFILWTRLGQAGADRRRAFLLIGFLMLFQLVFGVINLAFFGVPDMTWVADVAGFATGFVLSFVVSPGGWTAVLEKLRQG